MEVLGIRPSRTANHSWTIEIRSLRPPRRAQAECRPEPADPGIKAATNRPTCDAIMTGRRCLRPPHLTPPARKKPSVALRFNLILISTSSTSCPVFQRQFVSSPSPQTSSSPCLPSPSSVSRRAPSALPASSELLNCPGTGCRLPLLSPSAVRLSVPP